MSLSLPKEVLEKYINPTFIETGTHYGDGVQLAHNLGFKKIYSIEKNSDFFRFVDRRFSIIEKPQYGNIKLYKGNSTEILDEILSLVVWEPYNITFWLDAHMDPKEKDNTKQIPLLKELEIIARYCKTDDDALTPDILIDDRNQFGGQWHRRNYLRDIWAQISEQEVIYALRVINPNYRIVYEDNKFAKDGILVATRRPAQVKAEIKQSIANRFRAWFSSK